MGRGMLWTMNTGAFYWWHFECTEIPWRDPEAHCCAIHPRPSPHVARGVAMGQARQAIAWGPVFWGGPRQLTIWTVGNVIINNIHVTWSNMSASPPRGIPLALLWMCFLFPRDASAAVFKLAQHLLALLLGYFKNEKNLSFWQPKAEKSEERRKHDSGKLSDGDNIDLMMIIWQTNVFVVNSSLFSFNYLLYEILVQLLIGLLENRLARVALSSSSMYVGCNRMTCTSPLGKLRYCVLLPVGSSRNNLNIVIFT